MAEPDLRARLGFGCGRLFRTRSASARARLLSVAFDAGIRHFDVARMYGLGAAEAELGRFVSGKRELVSISTKFGIPITRVPAIRHIAQTVGRSLVAHLPAARSLLKRSASALYRPKDFTVAFAEKSLQESLREMRLERIDTLLLHEPTRSDQITEALKVWLEDQRSSGVVGSFGVSGELEEMLLAPGVAGFPWPVTQFAYNLFSPKTFRNEIWKGSLVVTFSAISGAIDRFSELLERSPLIALEIENRFSKKLDPVEISTILLRANLEAFPGSYVLFSTSRPERLKAIADRFATIEWHDGTLEWLRSHLTSEDRRP